MNAAAQDSQYSFDIPDQLASITLNQIAQKSRTPLLISYKVVKSIKANKVTGTLSLIEALDTALANTGLKAFINKDGLGGSIRTKKEFGDLHLHVEFRYPVEAGKKGQGRGNGSLILHGVGNIQILNSYALGGYWNESGAIYKKHPPKVNAAAPPLQWQTFDVDLTLPRFNADGKKLSNAILTMRLNGIIIHNHLEIESNAKKVSIGLEDHINRLQYRNIWVLEK